MKSRKIRLDDWSVFLQLERDLLRSLPVENPPVTPVRPAERNKYTKELSYRNLYGSGFGIDCIDCTALILALLDLDLDKGFLTPEFPHI
jgi:hypothetical protein